MELRTVAPKSLKPDGNIINSEVLRLKSFLSDHSQAAFDVFLNLDDIGRSLMANGMLKGYPNINLCEKHLDDPVYVYFEMLAAQDLDVLINSLSDQPDRIAEVYKSWKLRGEDVNNNSHLRPSQKLAYASLALKDNEDDPFVNGMRNGVFKNIDGTLFE